MKKLIMLLVLFSWSFAEDGFFVFDSEDVKTGWYLGISGGVGVTQDKYSGVVRDNIELDNYAFTTKIGYDNYLYRLEVSYTNNTLDDKSNQKVSSLNGVDIDYLAVYPRYKLRPYIGVGLGAHLWKGVEIISENTSRDLQSISYSISTGLFYQIDNIEFELAYEYRKNRWENRLFDSEPFLQRTRLNTFSLGLNYKF